MGNSCCTLNENNKIIIEEFENFRETNICLPVEEVKIIEKTIPLSIFNKTQSLIVKI